MGLFDRVYVDCPNCGNQVEFQSKGGECDLVNFSLDDAPIHVLMDMMNYPQECECGTWLAVIDPRAPASFVRPEVKVARVKHPHHAPFDGARFVWPYDRPFTKDDIEENDQ